MKVLFDYCRQRSRYQDSYGKALIELEGNETVDDVKRVYVDVKRPWHEQKYYSPLELSKHVEDDQVYEGRLVLLETHREYLD